MQKLLIIPFLALLPLVAAAQGTAYDGTNPPDWSGLELATALNPWSATENSAGLAFSPMKEFNTVNLSFSHESGDYRLRQTGDNDNDFRFDTKGAASLGKVALWGHFSYDYISSNGSTYNTLLYNPFDERFLYTVADPVESTWKRQSYFMEFKAALPLVRDRLYGGLHLKYNDRVAAKQNDPRAETYNYNITVIPSLIWRIGGSKLGLGFLYGNTFERSYPSVSNTQEPQLVYLLTGLGNYTTDYVGSNSLSTMYYRCNSYGGSLLYSTSLVGIELVSEAAYRNHGTEITESATQPDSHGKTSVDEIEASANARWGEEWRSVAKLGFKSRFTTGTEHTTIFDSSTGKYEIRSAIDQVKMKTYDFALSYDAYRIADEGYVWHLAAQAGVIMKDDSYALPYSCFTYDNAWLGLAVDKNLIFRNSSLLVGASFKALMNLSGEYEYGGTQGDSIIVTDLYTINHNTITSDYLQVGVSAAWAIALPKNRNFGLRLDASYLAAQSSLSRLSLSAAVSLIF